MFVQIIFIFVFLSSWATSDTPNFQTMKDFYDYYENKLKEEGKLDKLGWTFGRLYPENIPYEQVVRSNLKDINMNRTIVTKTGKLTKNTSNLPKTFDARKKWPNCQSIGKKRSVKDFNCHSEWALTAAAIITDRICISSGGAIKHEASALDILTCCRHCFDKDACEGGDPVQAWQFWVHNGVVSGTEDNGCKPYNLFEENDKECKQTCTNAGHKVAYNKDKLFGNRSYTFPSDAQQIQAEIMKNGPVQGIFKVYDDFFFHKAGVYSHVLGDFDGYGSVKIIGWGIEDEKKYWLVSKEEKSISRRSFVFKLLRGTIENAVAGLAKTDALNTTSAPRSSSSSNTFPHKFLLFLLVLGAIYSLLE